MSWFSQYRRNLYTGLLEANGISVSQVPPAWARVLRWCLFPVTMMRWSLLEMYDAPSMCLRVEGVLISTYAIETLAHGTAPGRWFRTRRDGDSCTVEWMDLPDEAAVEGLRNELKMSQALTDSYRCERDERNLLVASCVDTMVRAGIAPCTEYPGCGDPVCRALDEARKLRTAELLDHQL